MCSNLIAPEFGFINYTIDETYPYDLGTNAIYTCISGYQLRLSENFEDKQYNRTCVGNYSSSVGNWTGFDPECISKLT